MAREHATARISRLATHGATVWPGALSCQSIRLLRPQRHGRRDPRGAARRQVACRQRRRRENERRDGEDERVERARLIGA